MNQKLWRPRLNDNSPDINREGKFFAVACHSIREADVVEKALIKTLVKVRR